MINLLLAIASSALVSIALRLSEGKIQNRTALLWVNYGLCLTLAWWDAGFASFLPKEAGLGLALGLGGINGGLYLAGFVLSQYNIRKNGVVLSSIFAKLGLLVSIFVSILWFRELPKLAQGIGFFLAITAIILINYQPTGGKAASKWTLLLSLLASGSGDAMSKVFKELGNGRLSAHFLLYTFVSALILCTVLMLVRKEGRPGLQELGFGILLGIPNFFSAKFLLGALAQIPAVIVYPVTNVGTILTLTVTGVLVFKERLAKRQWVALGMILTALVLLNM